MGDALDDYSEDFEYKQIDERYKLTDEMKDIIGEKFIILPNSMYGTWWKALYECEMTLPMAEKLERMKKKLDYKG